MAIFGNPTKLQPQMSLCVHFPRLVLLVIVMSKLVLSQKY